MRLGTTSDTGAWSDVPASLDELAPVLDELGALHPQVDPEVFLCVRSLPDELGRKCRTWTWPPLSPTSTASARRPAGSDPGG